MYIIYVCTYVHINFISCSAIAILKKHYYNVLRSLPSDHMISLGRLCKVATVKDTTVDRVVSCSSSREANKEILDTLIYITDRDRKLLKFCNALEKIVGSDSDAVESLRSGWYLYVLNVHMYRHCQE